MKTNELTGAALDWAVAIAEGFDPETLNTKTGVVYSLSYGVYTPSTNWKQGGPIIERERIATTPMTPTVGEDRTPYWFANYEGQITYRDGPTPLIAAMRCYVASKLGDDVDVPKELL
jgi:hypothetical protein